MSAVVDLILPPRCPACHRPRAEGLCTRCAEAAGDLVTDDLAPRALAPGVTAVGAFHYDGVIADAVRTIKRPGRHAAARWLAAVMWAVVGGHVDVGSYGDTGGLPRTWVPATRAARRRRGVEIPRLLAGPQAVAMLRTTRDRPDQTTLDAVGRRGNVRGAFSALHPVTGTVVCVDDVRTTGSTLLAAAGALRAAGARRVLCVTLAVVDGDEAPDPRPIATGSAHR